MKYHQLTREQRYAIYLGLQAGDILSAIARRIQVNKSTVSREVRRNGNCFGKYGWTMERRERMLGNRALKQDIVREALRLLKTEDWSPGHMKLSGRNIFHESIYSMIRADESGELRIHCRHKMKYRRHVKVRRKTRVRNIPGRVSIHERPAESDGRSFGDWEMDLIVGKSPAGVAEKAVELLCPYRRNVPTITTDNGSKFSRHDTIAMALRTTVYFANSYSSWQKGAIENTNKIVRQYIPKGTDFTEFTDEFISSMQHKPDRRPRKKLNYSTPKDEFFNLLL